MDGHGLTIGNALQNAIDQQIELIHGIGCRVVSNRKSNHLDTGGRPALDQVLDAEVAELDISYKGDEGRNSVLIT